MKKKYCFYCLYKECIGADYPCSECVKHSLWQEDHRKIAVSLLCAQAHANAKEKGFWDQPREFGTMIALIHSELSEALEADRHGDKVRVAEELADVAIRLGDLCGGLGIDLESAILAKIEKNAARPKMHGKNY